MPAPNATGRTRIIPVGVRRTGPKGEKPAGSRSRRPDRLPDSYIRSIIAFPNPEHDTCVAPGINRAKS